MTDVIEVIFAEGLMREQMWPIGWIQLEWVLVVQRLEV
jgi:hypothetical protein